MTRLMNHNELRAVTYPNTEACDTCVFRPVVKFCPRNVGVSALQVIKDYTEARTHHNLEEATKIANQVQPLGELAAACSIRVVTGLSPLEVVAQKDGITMQLKDNPYEVSLIPNS